MEIEQGVADGDVTQEQSLETTENSSADSSTALDPLAYEKGVKLSEKIEKNPQSLQDILDLDKFEKPIRFKGKQYSVKDFEKAMMFQGDYTKKTQALAEERKSIQELQENKKYYDNLAFDLENVKRDPALKAEFLEIYPKAFHKFVDSISTAEQTQQAPAQTDKPNVEEDPKFKEMYSWFNEQRQEAATAKVNALFDRLGTKYPEADEEKVIAKVQTLIELSKKEGSQAKRPDEKAIEELFKAEHEKTLSRDKERLNKLLTEQRRANEKGRGPASGGGIPGQAPKMPKTLKEASKFALEDAGW